MLKRQHARNLGKPAGRPIARQGRPGRSAGKGGEIREANIAKLLEAAETVFAERGFAGATTQAIAASAKLPKANLHYYFRTKADLYRAVLRNVLALWLDELDRIEPGRDPEEALGEYVEAKMRWSRLRPNASKVFANEILHGARFLDGYLAGELRRRVEAKAAVMRDWIRGGRMAPIDPTHLIFQLWAMTQHYADFEVQVRAVLGRERLDDADFEQATETITRLVLRGCLPRRGRSG
ncbi:MAG: TetR family transcriptional regulator C-terminal domain-containing protein [Proteobacteria bacterium]|nr:TetR family transcriptional regulator C-terminal domain-containing protein [Pseudomonadota bacterium]MBI3497902.1 TetR family transcriptional regulator C-terminal domain-containing protein [Pseudomonadota bacterium]